MYKEILWILTEKHNIQVFYKPETPEIVEDFEDIIGRNSGANVITKEIFIPCEYEQMNNVSELLSALHEVGHIVLEHKLRPWPHTSSVKDRILREEREAWRFAFSILAKYKVKPSLQDLRLCKYCYHLYIFEFEAREKLECIGLYQRKKLLELVKADNESIN